MFFLLPHHDKDGNARAWREVIYGLLEVNQLAMSCRRKRRMENSYGFSLRTRQEPTVPATFLRLAQAIIQCLLPSILELVPTSTHPDVRIQRQARLRLRLEQLKFAIRMYLMCSYWYQISIESNGSTTPGIMLDGGLYLISN